MRSRSCRKRGTPSIFWPFTNSVGVESHALVLTRVGLGLDRGGVAVGVEAGVEDGLVQAQAGRETLEVVLAEGAAVLAELLGVELVVVVPEAALLGGAVGRRGGPHGLLAEEGQIVPDQFHGAVFDERLV